MVERKTTYVNKLVNKLANESTKHPVARRIHAAVLKDTIYGYRCHKWGEESMLLKFIEILYNEHFYGFVKMDNFKLLQYPNALILLNAVKG